MRFIVLTAVIGILLLVGLAGCGSCGSRGPDSGPAPTDALPEAGPGTDSEPSTDALAADATPSDASGPCVPDNPPWEVCDGRDNDCDGTTDLGGCAPGLEAWYRFEETTGMAIDSSGNGWHGTVVGPLLRGFPTPVGSGLGCVGGTDRVEVAGGPMFDASSGWTIEVWVGYVNWPAGNTVFWKGTGGSPPNVDAHVNVDASTITLANITWNACDSAYCNQVPDLQQLVPADSFGHVALSYDGFFLREFLNGLEAGSLLDTTFAFSTWDEDLTMCRLLGAPGDSWDGILDELKFWSVARTEAEICSDAGGTYSAGPPAACALP